jgi:5-methylthioribose kinase
MPFSLTVDNAVPYLVSRGVIAAREAGRATATLLGGGVSNIVIRVSTSGDTDGALVIKQSLPQLRVAQDWFADRRRIHREWASIQYLANVLPPGAIPRVIYADEQDYLYVMTAAPEDGVNWKEALLSGQIDAAVAGEVGRLLGEIHRATRIDHGQIPELLQPFANQDCFVQLRIDPYHRATAAIHADLADLIEGEAQRMLNRHLVMVHGDYSPKNVIVAGAGESAHVFLLDFEVVHLGNPVFDLAFMLNHLALKAIHRPELAARYNTAARAFWDGYVVASAASTDSRDELEADTMRQLGVLLLARVDGKSPAEYIDTDAARERVRRLARSVFSGDLTSLSHVHAWLTDEASR